MPPSFILNALYHSSMSVRFNILPGHGLVYVRLEGDICASECLATFNEYAKHPECRPGQKQLIDFSRATGLDSDFVKLIELQARKADIFLSDGAQTLTVYYAPCRHTRELAKVMQRNWEAFPGVVTVIQDDEAAALSILGLRMASFDQLLEQTF